MPYLDKDRNKRYQQEYREKNKEKLKEYRKKKYSDNPIKYIEKSREYGKLHKERKKEYDKEYRETNKDRIKKANEFLKMKAYEIIADYQGSKIKCWKCGEDRPQCLTVGHINNNGKEDRASYGRGKTFHKKIISGERMCEDLRLECYNCNYVSYHYGKYPNELRELHGRNETWWIKYKTRVYETICKHHRCKIACWRCGEELIEVLTVGHINQDGAREKKEHGNSLFSRILSGKRSCEDLKIECWNCNCAKYYYGKYPDEGI
jgi:hypothetical protein